MNKKKKLCLLIVGILFILAVGIAVILGLRKKDTAVTAKNLTEEEQLSMAENQGQTEKQVSKSEERESEKTTNKTSNSDTEKSDSAFFSDGESDGTLIQVPEVVVNVDLSQKEEKEPTVSLPYTMSDSNLVVKSISSYDGIFVEDGSDREISGIAAAVLQNQGSTGIEYAEVTVKQGEKTMVFKASAVPAGSTVVVMESNAASYEAGEYTSIYGAVAEKDSFEMSESEVQVTDNGDNTLTVTNISGKEIPCVRLFYKYLMEDNIYVGGIAYMAKVTDLQAGASQTVGPAHYGSGSSEVVMVRTYDTKD